MTDDAAHDAADNTAADDTHGSPRKTHATTDHRGSHHHGHRHAMALRTAQQPGHPHSAIGRVGNAVRLVFGRGQMASVVVDVARLTPADRVVDIGRGPGTAVRVASRRCVHQVGS